MYFLDADICIEFMRGRLPEGLRVIETSEPSMFKIPAVVVGELLTGVEKSKDRARNRLVTERFLAPFEIVPYDAKCAAAYARLRVYLEGNGIKIGPKDTMIAATALAHSAVLVTNNVGEFKRVPGLQLESWGVVDLQHAMGVAGSLYFYASKMCNNFENSGKSAEI